MLNELQEFFRFSTDFFDWRFFVILLVLLGLGLVLPPKLTHPFRSVRFNVGVFVLVALASALGTVLPQNGSLQETLTAWGPFWGSMGRFFHIEHIYHSWWFTGLLALLAFDVIVCKLRRLPRQIFGPPKSEQGPIQGPIEKILARASHQEEVVSSTSFGDTCQRLQDIMRNQSWSFQEADAYLQKKAGVPIKSKIFYTGRHFFQRWGDFLLHVSLVGILAGNFLGALLGFEEHVIIEEGSVATLQNRPYAIHLKDFEIDYYPATQQPRLYASDIIVQKKDRVLGQKRVVVNDPLDIEGVRFYQASWGMTDQFRSATLSLLNQKVELKPGKITFVPDLPFQIRANRYYPTFDLNENNRVINRDGEGSNPAIQLDFLEQGKIRTTLWILQNRPDVAFQVVGDHSHPIEPPPFQLIEVDPVLFSGIQVGYDPGATMFWIFSILFLIGLALHFYWHQRRLRILVVPEKKGATVIIGGWNSRVPEEFQKEFHAWVQRIQAGLV